MEPVETIKSIQGLLGVKKDGRWGGISQAALDAVTHAHATRQLSTDADGWDWLKVRVDGNDLVIDNATVTAFGGPTDKMDDGQTASGVVNTAKDQGFIGCALPMCRNTSAKQDAKGRSPILRGSPIPKLPWLTKVRFTDTATGKYIETTLIDEGPAGWTKHAGDLTVAAARHFDPMATANEATLPKMQIRIIGGAQYA